MCISGSAFMQLRVVSLCAYAGISRLIYAQYERQLAFLYAHMREYPAEGGRAEGGGKGKRESFPGAGEGRGFPLADTGR